MDEHLSDVALWGRILARAENVTLALKRDMALARLAWASAVGYDEG